MNLRIIAISGLILISASIEALAQPDFNSNWTAESLQLPNENCFWTLRNTSIDTIPTVADTGLVIAGLIDSERINYEQLGASLLSMPDTLVIEFSARYVGGAGSPTQTGLGVLFEVRPPMLGLFFVGEGEAFLMNSVSQRGDEVDVPTRDRFHVYKIIVFPDDSIRVVIDGVPRLMGSLFDPGATPGQPRIFWGDIFTESRATSEWMYFRHNASISTCGPPVGTQPISWGRLRQLLGSSAGGG